MAAAALLWSFVMIGSPAHGEQGGLYSLSANTIDGDAQKLSVFDGKVVLVVNVASYCGYTSQYEGLEQLYQNYRERGFAVLGFPSNDFGQQEPGSDGEIKKFCSERFGVTFPLFSKVKVLGENKDPVYRFLTASTGGVDVGWNFEKCLVGRNGSVVGRFESGVTPDSPELKSAIEKALS
ncbi:MAG: glutathione peroxidase [Alphaproteobacteria bacterium]